MKRKNQIILILFVCSFVSLNIYNVEAHQITNVLYNQIFIPTEKIEYVSRDWIYKLRSHDCRLQGLNSYSWFSISNSSGSRLHKGIQILFDSIPRQINVGIKRDTPWSVLFNNEHLWSVYYEQAVDFAGTTRYYQFNIDFLYSGLVTNTASIHTFNLTGIRVWLYETYNGHIYVLNEIVVNNETVFNSFEWNLAAFINPSGFMAFRSVIRNDSINIQSTDYQYLFSAGNVYLTAMTIQGKANFRTGLAGISYFNTYFTLSNVYIRTFYSTVSDRTTTPLIPSYISNSDFRNPVLPDSIQNTINWTYKVFSLTSDVVENISYSREYEVFNETLNASETNSYNFSTQFQKLKINETTAVFTITKNVISYDDWGNWEIKWFQGTAMESSVNFNWLRNAFVNILNFMLLVMQIVLFLLVASLQYLLLIFLYIAIIIWNFPIFWIFVGMVGVVFYISFFFVWLWNQIVILWKLIIEPLIEYLWNWIVKTATELMEYMKNEGFLWLYGFIIVVFSYIASAILYVLAFGSVDYNTIFQFVLTMNTNIFLFFYEIFRIFVDNILVFLQFVVLYFIALGFLLMKLIYAKAKGYTSRVEKLQSAINFYKYPIDLIYRLIQMFIGMKSTENN